jgi:hypothetical protein
MTFTRLRRKLVGWIGMALILLNVLAPTLSHALRAGEAQPAAERQHQHRSWVLAVAGDWCVSTGQAISPRQLAAIDALVAIQQTLDELQACGYCADPPLAGAAPLPDAPALCGPAPEPGAAVFAAYAEVRLSRPAFERPASHAPPLV